MHLSTYEKNNLFEMEMLGCNLMEINNYLAINNRFSLILIETGSGILRINEKVFSFVAPTLICLNEQENIIIDKSLNCCIKVIYFHPKIINCIFNFENIRNIPSDFNITLIQDSYLCTHFINRPNNTNELISLGPTSFNKFKTLFNKFIEESTTQNNNYWPCRSRSYILEILNLVDNQYIEDIDSQPIQEYNEDFLNLVTYINNNYNTKITILHLSKKFNINRTSLTEKFKKYTGDSLISYINKLRIKMASTLLRDTRIPISEIMERVGFNDSTHFLRTFKKYMYMTPKAYRDNYCWVD